MCDLYEKEKEFWNKLGLELKEKCTLEQHCIGFDPKTCSCRKICKKAIKENKAFEKRWKKGRLDK